MLRRLREIYSRCKYQCHFDINPQGEKCNDTMYYPDCNGFQPYITITSQQKLTFNHQTKIVNLTAIVIADCDECRRESNNPYVKSSTDLELVLKACIPGIGELCRRERQGDYFFFEELRYVSCDVCQKTWHMPRTVHDQNDNDEDAMEKRSGRNTNLIEEEMMANVNPCREHHDRLMGILNAALNDFNQAISRRQIPTVLGGWYIYKIIDLYLDWRFIRKAEPYPFEEIYAKLILLLLARKHDKGSLISWLPKDVLKMILLIVKQPWMTT